MINHFKNRLIKLMTDTGVSGKKLASSLKVSESTITNWKKGINYPNKTTLLQIGEIFSVTVDYLLGVEDEKVITRQIDVEGLNDKQISALEEIIDAFKKVNTQ